MSDGGAEAPLWMPDLGDMPAGPARILVWLVVWRDGRGSCDPTNAELCKVTKLDESTVRKHTAWLASEGWATRERRRREDNSLGGWRYWLNLPRLGLAPASSLENLGVGESEGGKSAGASGDVAPVEKSVEARAENVEVPPGAGAEGGAENLQVPPESEGGKTAGVEHARAGARAEFPLPSSSYFLSFPWRDDDTKKRAGEILAACGPGIGVLGAQGNRLLNSLAYVLDEGLWAGFDWALDVLPTVARKTGPGRKSALWDFALITENIETLHAKRLRDADRAAKRDPARGAKPKSGGGFRPSAMSDEDKRDSRIKGLRGTIRLIDEGHEPKMLLPFEKRQLDGQWLADAFAELRAASVLELERLEAESGNGGGNG